MQKLFDAIVLGRVTSFGDAAYITETIALHCTNVLGTINNITGTIIHVTLSAKIYPTQSC
jgi:hypothetical protein